MRIVNTVQQQDFDTLENGEFFCLFSDGNSTVFVKTAHRSCRALVNGRISDNIQTVGNVPVFPVELSTCRFRRASKRV